MSTLREKIFQNIHETTDIKKPPRSKVTIVGTGQVGMAAAFSILMQGTVGEIALVDVAEDKLKGEVMDLQHGLQFLRPCVIQGGTDFKISAGSKVVVLTAGVRQREGESRLNLVQRNVDIFKSIIPKIVSNSPDCILVVASNPVDVLTYVTWKISGLPRNRVIGTGTMLDSARFRFLLSEKLDVSPSSVHGYVLGEHGDSSVAVWSSVSVGGVNLLKIKPDIGSSSDPEKFGDIHKEVIESAYNIIKLKGYTSWAIGLTISSLVSAIVKNTSSIYALSTHVKNFYGIADDICLSLPCVVGSGGISTVVNYDLADEEKSKLLSSAKTLSDVINGIKW